MADRSRIHAGELCRYVGPRLRIGDVTLEPDTLVIVTAGESSDGYVPAGGAQIHWSKEGGGGFYPIAILGTDLAHLNND